MRSKITVCLTLGLIAAVFLMREVPQEPETPNSTGHARKLAMVKSPVKNAEDHGVVAANDQTAEAVPAQHQHEIGHDCEESARIAEKESALIQETPENPQDVLVRELGADWKNQFALTKQDFTDIEGRPTDYDAFVREQDELAERNENLPGQNVGVLAREE